MPCREIESGSRDYHILKYSVCIGEYIKGLSMSLLCACEHHMLEYWVIPSDVLVIHGMSQWFHE